MKFLGTLFFLLFGCAFASNSDRDIIVDLVSREMSFNHYQKLQLDENFSQRFFDMYIGSINYNSLLTQEDIDLLSQKYRFTSVQDFKNRSHYFFNDSFDLFLTRKEELFSILIDFFSNPIDYQKDSVFTNQKFEQQNFLPKSSWKNYFEQLHHASVISDMYTEYERRKFNKKESPSKDPNDLPEIELEIRNKNLEAIKKKLEELKKDKEIIRKNLFSVYLNSFLQTHDPHCVYRDPIDSSRFQDNIAGQIQGVGIRLENTAEGPRVAEIIVGGPAWLQGEVKVNDILFKVGQETGPLIETASRDINDVILVVRGKKGSKAKIVLKRVDGSFHTVLIKRDFVVLESKVCKSALIQKQDVPIGYIYLPSFYSSSFSEQNGHGCSLDVRKQLLQLQRKNIQGLIFDVRGNPGGVLSEVVDILGFFLQKGPVLQVRTRGNQITTIGTNPRNSAPIFSGPMVILIDEVSASASEILAAAIQDYHRGLILGSTKHTHGKGTVQRPIDLSSQAKRIYNYNKEIGSLVLTTQKFYRINGGATQIEGVSPDILLLKDSQNETGEGKLKNALPWDEIPPVGFQFWKNSPRVHLESIQNLFENRIKNNTSPMNLVENYLKEKNNSIKNFDFNEIPLSCSKYSNWTIKKKQYLKSLQKIEDGFSNQLKKFDFTVEITGGFEQSLRSPERGAAQVKKWQELILSDLELQESVQILQDLIDQMKLEKRHLSSLSPNSPKNSDPNLNKNPDLEIDKNAA